MDKIKKNFGFGCMRLPMIGEDVDIEQTRQMVDLFLKEKSINAKGRHRLLYVHANRFLLHLVLEEYTKNKEYCDKYFDLEHMEKDVNRLCKKYCKKIYDIMESEAYRDAYPAYLFKNSTKLKEINGIITNQQ